MKHILRIALCVLAALLHCASAPGQKVSNTTVRIAFERAEVSPSELPEDRGPLEFDTQARPDLVFEGIEERLAGNAFDPLAEHLLRVSTDVTLELFRISNLKLERAITYRDETGDNLVIRWAVDESFGKGTVILWNNPYAWLYAMRLEGCRIGSRQQLSAFLNGLVNWSKVPKGRPSYTVELANDDPGLGGFRGHNSAPMYRGLRDFDIIGVPQREAWFLTVGAGPAATYHRDGSWTNVPERFPPLTELIKKWSFDQIRAQVGAPVGPKAPSELVGSADGEIYFVPTANRDRILVAELARRGLTAEQVVELLTDVKPKYLFERLGVVEEALRQAGKGPDPDSYLSPALQVYRRIGQPAEEAASSLYRTVGLKCSPAEEAEALKDLKQGIFQEGPMTYLGMCSRSPGSLRALEQTPVPDHLVSDKARHLEEIRHRLGMPPKEKPPENPVPSEDGPD